MAFVSAAATSVAVRGRIADRHQRAGPHFEVDRVVQCDLLDQREEPHVDAEEAVVVYGPEALRARRPTDVVIPIG